ncbi:transmembrane protein, putative [Medicago truncatula]|uniref:Transmembrane protein, putative n=1 Tax=Medicago truncatula TaxID=3880 RepID=G7KMJ0_MEDTR|nr:transmembrane protein, putative [Medicago truncatula]
MSKLLLFSEGLGGCRCDLLRWFGLLRPAGLNVPGLPIIGTIFGIYAETGFMPAALLRRLLVRESFYRAGAMKIVKNQLCNKIGDQWLNDHLVTYTERYFLFTINIEVILNHVQQMDNRRFLLYFISISNVWVRPWLYGEES